VVIRVTDRMMFGPGSDRLSPACYPFLDEIIRLIDRLNFNVLIEGHTDNTPIKSRRFPSNWELSTSRAISVLHYLRKAGAVDVRRLGSAGYADTRPIVPNSSPANRAHNRRVEFICHRDTEKLGRTQAEPPAPPSPAKKRPKGKKRKRR
jgi:chemotaxis protein MotB